MRLSPMDYFCLRPTKLARESLSHGFRDDRALVVPDVLGIPAVWPDMTSPVIAEPPARSPHHRCKHVPT
jgi:hypothetical protein